MAAIVEPRDDSEPRASPASTAAAPPPTLPAAVSATAALPVFAAGHLLEGEEAPVCACDAGDVGLACLILASGAPPNEARGRRTPLLVACSSGNLPLAQALLDELQQVGLGNAVVRADGPQVHGVGGRAQDRGDGHQQRPNDARRRAGATCPRQSQFELHLAAFRVQ